MADAVERLLPCPFCGSTNIDPEGWVSTERKGPACDDCAGCADTVELWNSRPLSQAGAGGVVVRPLEWSEHAPPNGKDCFYDHVRAETPFGRYSIEWKSWKSSDWPTVDFRDEFFHASPTVDKAKAAAQADYEARILAALAPMEPAKRWPFVESPGDFTARLASAFNDLGGDMLAAVRNVLIENPPTLATPPTTPVQPTASVEAVIKEIILEAMSDLRADIHGDIDGTDQAADWAAAKIASLSAPKSRFPFAWAWQDDDLAWQATCDEDRAHHSARVKGYEIIDLYREPEPQAPIAADIADLVAKLEEKHGCWRYWDGSYTIFTSLPEQAVTALKRLASLTPGDGHPDNLAVDRFAVAMKAKLAKKRAEGRGGWEDKDGCSNGFLSQLLREHIDKGDPVDVGNLAMMIHQRGERIATPSSPVSSPSPAGGVREAIEAALDFLGGVDGASDVRAQLIAALSSPEPVSAPAGEVVEAFRFLRIGDVIEAGDECPTDNCAEWEPVNRWAVGMQKSVVFKTIRRRIAALNPAPGHGEGGL